MIRTLIIALMATAALAACKREEKIVPDTTVIVPVPQPPVPAPQPPVIVQPAPGVTPVPPDTTAPMDNTTDPDDTPKSSKNGQDKVVTPVR